MQITITNAYLQWAIYIWITGALFLLVVAQINYHFFGNSQHDFSTVAACAEYLGKLICWPLIVPVEFYQWHTEHKRQQARKKRFKEAREEYIRKSRLPVIDDAEVLEEEEE